METIRFISLQYNQLPFCYKLNDMKLSATLLTIISLLLLGFSEVNAQSKTTDGLLKGFLSPPAAARPRVWWHWMNGNITKEGIRKDLEWMKRSGIGGFQNFDASLGTPQIVEKRLTYMTSEWKDAFYFTARLADSLKLEMAIAGSPGWSESGGPWVKPEDGMKKIVWTATRTKGGSSNIIVQKPAGVTGPFQNIPKGLDFGESEGNLKQTNFYKDIAVVAFKLPEADKSLSELNPVVTSSGGKFTLSQLTDGDVGTTSLLPRDSTAGFGWIQFAFSQPQTIKAITMVGGGNAGVFGYGADPMDSRKLEVSDDGVNFKFVCIIPVGAVLQQTITIPPTTAKYFRVKVKNPPPPVNLAASFGMGDMEGPKDPGGTAIAEIVLHTADRINMVEEKDAFAPVGDLNKKITTTAIDIVATTDIIDITNKLQADGLLNWTAPPGEWKVIRFGYSLMGIKNHPASPEATGLEVDKLDPVAIKKYFENYLDQYKNATRGLMGNKGGLQFMVTDSWEAGAQNWTANLPAEFQKRRGYNIIPWLPVLTGQVVKSAEASEQFLWDYRKTLSELVSAYHYDQLTTLLAERGMKRYSESHEGGRALIADGMEVKRKAAIPMSAMWTPSIINGFNQIGYQFDIRESASVAHLYGQNLVAAESMTAFGPGGNAWAYSPEILKPTADLELACGLNRFVIHTSVHQPTDDKIPGLGLGPFGQWFNRHDTWAEQARAWTNYLARSSYMLQQGKFVADVVYYYGEDNNITSLFGNRIPAIPEGYNYDFVNADALLHLISVKDGKLVTVTGMQYKILALDSNSRQMTLLVARKIRDLVKAGAIVVGPRPDGTPSLSDNKKAWNAIVTELWGPANNIVSMGNGKVYSGQSITDVLNSLNIAKDFEYSKADANTKILYVHRKLPQLEFYWINNRSNKIENIEAGFRVTGKSVEIWHPETGKTEMASYSFANGQTKVPLRLEPNDAVFVVFKENTNRTSYTVTATFEKELTTISDKWSLSFQANRGAPATAAFDNLISWTESKDPGIKYFSGTGTYTHTIDAPADWFEKGAQLWIDLGDVKSLAEVAVNGKSLGIVWKNPFRVEVTNALRKGDNIITVKVTNLWVNRLIGDQQPDVVNKITYTTMPFYQANSRLFPSGLLGPVRLLSVK